MTWRFVLNNGCSGSKEIVDPLIADEDAARQRADAEFLDGGYYKRFVSLMTHRTDISIGDVLRVEGLAYLVTAVSVKYERGVLMSDVSGVRYE